MYLRFLFISVYDGEENVLNFRASGYRALRMFVLASPQVADDVGVHLKFVLVSRVEPSRKWDTNDTVTAISENERLAGI